MNGTKTHKTYIIEFTISNTAPETASAYIEEVSRQATNGFIASHPGIPFSLYGEWDYVRDAIKKNNAAEAGETVQISGTAAPV